MRERIGYYISYIFQVEQKFKSKVDWYRAYTSNR